MATRTITSQNTSLITALGGTVNANDSVYINNYAVDYSAADLSATDLARVELTPGYSGRMTAAAGAQLKLVVNQTGSGILVNRSNSPELEIISTSASGVIATIVDEPAFGGAKVTIDICAPTEVFGPGVNTRFFGASCDLSSAVVWLSDGRTVFRKTASAATYPVATLNLGGNAVAECHRDATTVNIGGNAVFAAMDSDCSPTTVNMQGGRFDMGKCSAVGTLQGSSGVVDQRNLTTPITISTMDLPPTVEIWRSRQTVVPTVSTDNSPAGGPKIVLK